MARFGRAAAWRNMATYGALDETRHSQLQTYVPYQALSKEPRLDWAHKAYTPTSGGSSPARHLFDDMFTANDAVSMAIQLDLHVRDRLHQPASSSGWPRTR